MRAKLQFGQVVSFVCGILPAPVFWRGGGIGRPPYNWMGLRVFVEIWGELGVGFFRKLLFVQGLRKFLRIGFLLVGGCVFGLILGRFGLARVLSDLGECRSMGVCGGIDFVEYLCEILVRPGG